MKVIKYKSKTHLELRELANMTGYEWNGEYDGGYVEQFDNLFPKYVRLNVLHMTNDSFIVVYVKKKQVNKWINKRVDTEKYKKYKEYHEWVFSKEGQELVDVRSDAEYINNFFYEVFKDVYTDTAVPYDSMYVSATDYIFEYLDGKVKADARF